MTKVATARAMVFAIGSPPTPHRVEGETSAATTIGALLSWSNSWVMSGLKFVKVDCAQSIVDSRSPGCQSRRPARSCPLPWNMLGWPPMANSCMRRTMTSSTSWISDQDTSASSASVCSVRAVVMESAPCR